MSPKKKTVRLSARARRLLHYIRQNPGAVLRDLRGLSGVGWGTFYLVIEELERAGLVQEKRQGRAVFVYPSGMKMPKDPQGDRLSAALRRMAVIIIRSKGMDMRAIMEESGLSARMAYHHVQRLVRGGFVESEEEGRYRGLRPTAKLFRTLGLEP